MFNFFEGIYTFFELSFSLIVNFCKSFFQGISYLALSLPASMGILQYMPAFIGGFGIAILSIATVKIIIGR